MPAGGQIIRENDFPPVVSATQSADELGVTSTSYTPGSNVCGVVFVAPTSGRVRVRWHARFEHNDTSRASVSAAVRTGGTIGSGTPVASAGDGFCLENVLGTGGTNSSLSAGMFRTVTGLTPGATYNAQVEHRIQAGTSMDIFDRSISVKPLT